MAILGQVKNDLEQIENNAEQVGARLERIENDLPHVQAKHGAVKDRLGLGEDPFEQFELAEDAFKKVKLAFKQAEDESRKLEANERTEIASKLKEVQARIEQLKARRAKVIARLGQVDDEPTIYDFMGFERFANTISSIIIKSFDPEIKSNTTRMRIGIYGDWGSGKTSFLKMIESALLKEKIYPIWFQAWQYRHQEEELWSALTQKILDDARVDGPWYRRIWIKLRIWSNNNINWHDGLLEILRKVWRPVLSFLTAIAGILIISFSGNAAARGFSSIPYLSTLITVLGGGLVAAGLVKPVNDLIKALRGNLGIDFEKFKQKPAYRQKVAFWDQFSKEFETIVRLTGQGKPLVVIIDDLDRCLPEDALQVLEAIKNLLDVRGCIFILGLDRKVVEKVIAVKYKDMFESQSGEESIEEKVLPVKRFFYEDYVDKIFQLAITLPKLSSPESMKNFIKGVTYDEDVRNCIEVFSIGLSPNPRRIKRVLRTFLFVRDIAIAEDETAAEWEEIAIKRLLLAKLIVMQSEFPDVFNAITENASLLKDLEQYYRKSAGDTTRHPGGGTDSSDMTGKSASTETDSTNLIGKATDARIHDIIITGSVDLEEARTTKVGTESSRTTSAETGSAADNDAKAETDVSKEDTTLGVLAERYAANYPNLPKVLIEGGSKKEAYFSKLDLDGIKHYIVLIGALAEARPDREELGVAIEKQRQALLQAYLDRMAKLVEGGRNEEEVINEAQKQTERVLIRLDAVRKGLVLQSLYRLGLINQIDWTQADLVGCDLNAANLSLANLREANLREANLRGANLRGANLRGANLRGAILNEAILNEAILNEAILNEANLREANLRGADLRGANLRGADLRGALLGRAKLNGADLSEAHLGRAELNEANLRGANLRGANLRGANLNGAELSKADLSKADLSEADLSEAILSGAILNGAELSEAILSGAILNGAELSEAILSNAIVANEQLEQAKSLQGAIMPDGSIYS